MRFIFQHNLPCGPHTSSIGAAVFVSIGNEAFILLVKKPSKTGHDVIFDQASYFLCWGTHDSQRGPNQEIRKNDKLLNSHWKEGLIRWGVSLMKQNHFH